MPFLRAPSPPTASEVVLLLVLFFLEFFEVFRVGNGGVLNLVGVAGVKLGAWRRVERVALPAEAGGRRTRVGVVMAAPPGRGESVVPQAATIVAPGNELFRTVAFWSWIGQKKLVLLGFW